MLFSGRLEEVQSSTPSSQEVARNLQDLTVLSSILQDFATSYANRAVDLEDSYCGPGTITIACPVLRTGRPGRPSVIISEEQLATLLDLGFTYATMAAMFGISERTLLRRRTELGLQIGRHFTDISDRALDTAVRALVQVRACCLFYHLFVKNCRNL